MDYRQKLALELLLTCPPDSYSDLCKITDAVELGTRRDDILDMPVVNRWPVTAAWIAERL